MVSLQFRGFLFIYIPPGGNTLVVRRGAVSSPPPPPPTHFLSFICGSPCQVQSHLLNLARLLNVVRAISLHSPNTTFYHSYIRNILLLPRIIRYCTDCLLAFCCTCVSASMKPPDVLALSPVLLKAAEMMSDTIGRKMLRNTGNGGDETEITEEPPEAEHGIAKFRTAGKAIMAGHQIQSLYKKSLQRHLNIVSDGESDDTLVDTDLMNIAIPKCKYKHPVAVQENTNRFSTCAGCNKTLVPRLERFYCSVCNKDYCSCCIHKSIIRDGDAPANDMIVEKCFNVSWCCEAWNQSLIAGVTAFATIMLILIVVVISGNL